MASNSLINNSTDIPLRLGILSIQGAFAEHAHNLQRAFDQLKLDSKAYVSHSLKLKEIRRPDQLDDLDGLILPGGESTTASKFLMRAGFQEKLKDWIRGDDTRARFTWGTCAGLILLANHMEDMKTGGQLSLGGLDITVTRNKYGRQNDSFEAPITLHNIDLIDTGPHNYPGVFIRAPGINYVETKAVEILAALELDGKSIPVAVQQGHIMATSFHPELTDDLRWHAYFIHQVAQRMTSHPTTPAILTNSC